MKTLLLLLAAVAWAAASLSGQSRPGMVSNREYWYEYDSQVLTGISVLNKQYSGLKVRARVMLQKGSDEYVTLKVSDCRVYRVREDADSWRAARIERSATEVSEERQRMDWEHRDVDSETEDRIKADQVRPTSWLPDSLLEELPQEHSNIIINEFIKPMRFRYENGLITKVYADGGDAYWSVNIKKGILSMLYLDLNAANQVSDVEVSHSASLLDVIRPDYTSMSAKTGFKVKEPSTIGNCEAFYSLIPDHTLEEIHVTKVLETNKCVPKILAESGLFSGIPQSSDVPLAKKVVIEPSISSEYILRGSRHDFLIKKALLSAKYSVVPSEKSDTGMDGYVLQKLSFVKDEVAEHSVHFETTPVLLTTGLLQFVPLANRILGEGSQIQSSRRDVSTEIKMIDELLDSIVQKSRDGIEREVPDMLSAITTVLRKCSKEDIKDIIDTYLVRLINDPSSQKKKGILLDVLKTVPHPDMAVIVKHLIKERMVSGISAAIMVSQMSMTIPPSPSALGEYREMSRDPAVTSHKAVHKAVLLGMGAICNKMINIHKKMGLATNSVTSIVKDIVKDLKLMIQSGDKEKRILAIKTMGNMGDPSILSDLERIIKDKFESAELRKLAIYSCKKLAFLMPRVVRNLLLPVYMRSAEPTEVRVAAFLMVMETRPGYSTLHVISSSLEEEKKLALASFVYSYLQNMARTSIPELKPIKRLAIKVLKVTRPLATAAVFSSGSKRYEAFSDKMQVGFDTEMNSIRKSHSVLPSAFVSRIHMHCFGTAINFGEIGVDMVGANEIVRKLVGSGGILGDILNGRKDIASVLDHLSRPDFGQSAKQELDNILSKIDLREVSKMDLVKVSAYARIFDNEYGFLTLDKNAISDIISTAKDSYHELIPKLTSGYEVHATQSIALVGNSMIVPTPLGIPLTLNISIAGMMKAKGRITLEGSSSIIDIYNGQAAKLKVDLRPTVAVKMFHNLGIATDLFEIGTTLKRVAVVDVPLKIESEINLNDKKVVFKSEVPSRIAPTAFVELKPALYTLVTPVRPLTAADYEKVLPKITDIDCSKRFRVVNIEKEIRIPVSEAKARVRVTSSIMDSTLYDPLTSYFTKNMAGISIEPQSSTEKLVAEIRYGEQGSGGSSQSSGSWFSGWWGSNEEQRQSAGVAREEFEHVSPRSDIENEIKRKLFIELKYEGKAVTPKIQSKIVLINNPSMTKAQLNTQVIAKNIGDMQRPAKVMLDAYVNVPRLLQVILEGKPKSQSSSAEIASIEIDMGRENVREGKITFKVLPYTASDDADIPEEYGLRAAKKLPVKSVNIKIVSEATDTVSENVGEWCRQAIDSKRFAVYKPVLPMVSYTTGPLGSVNGNKAIIAIQFVPAVGKINCIYANKKITAYLLDQPLPSILTPQVDIIPLSYSAKDIPTMPALTCLTRVPKDISSAFYGVCKLRPSFIETFGQVSMKWSGLEEDCEVVLAHDCSPQRLFTVTSSPVRATGVRKIKVVIPQYKVVTGEELIRGASSIKINGEAVSVHTSQPIVHTKTASDGSVRTILKVERVDAERLLIKCPEVGLVVETDGRFADVKLSPVLASSACGVCSHTPSVHAPVSSVARSFGSSKVLSGPYSIDSFISKYLLSSSSCAASTRQPGPSATCAIRHQTLVRNPNPGEVCMSVRPVATCSDFCDVSRSLPQAIGFTCMPANSTTTQILLRKRHSQIISEVTNKVADYQETVDIAQDCIANYSE